MKHISEAIPEAHRTATGNRRKITLPDDDPNTLYAALMRSQAAGRTREQFEADRLHRNGWTAQDELEFQEHCRVCGLYLANPALIQALQEAPARAAAEQEKRRAHTEAQAERKAIQAEEPTDIDIPFEPQKL